MSLIDKAKQHLQSAAGVAQNAAEAALEAGQTLSAQAQSQLALAQAANRAGAQNPRTGKGNLRVASNGNDDGQQSGAARRANAVFSAR